jgi:amino acid transporter
MAAPDSQADRSELARFGYAQQLFRGMGGFSNFAISFSIISVLTGAVTLFGYGFQMGGPLEMTLGWPLATVFMLIVAASMGELCSAYPTSGSMYHWAADLGGPSIGPCIGWFVALFNIVGIIASQAGVNYSCAQFILPFLGIPATPAHLFLMFAFIVINQALLNQFGIRLIAMLNDLSASVHILGVTVLVAAVFWLAPLQPIGFLTHATSTSGQSPYWWAFLLGLLQAHWTYTGFDASASMSEETQDPRRRAPWGMVLAVAIAGITGYALILALTLAIRDPQRAMHMTDANGNEIPAAIAILQTALGSRFGNTLAALASVAMWFCGLSGIASGSRVLFALARDNGLPASKLLSRVNPRHRTPGPAIWVISGACVLAMLWTGAVPIVTSLSTVALYIAYIVPVALGLRARWQGSLWPQSAAWSLGKYGAWLNAAGVVYITGIIMILMMPPNQLAGKTVLGLTAILAITYPTLIRRTYQGPAWTHSSSPAPITPTRGNEP